MMGFQNRRFEFAPPTVAPVQDIAAPAQPVAAYVNGAGGARLTPEMIAQRGRMSQNLIASGMDTSPVGSWTQGAARVAQALVGNMQQNRLDDMSARNEADSKAALAGLGTGGDEQSIAAILANPYLNEGVKDVAKLRWQDTHRAPVQPHYWETNNGSLGMIGPDGKPVIAYSDPTPKIDWLTAENPDGTKQLIPVGPNGPMQRGGDPSAGVPNAPVGKLTPIGGGAPSQGARTFP